MRLMPAWGAFGSLNKLEQYARLKVWIGRFRFYQASQDRETELSEDLQALSHRVFHQLKWLSRQYEPGYIEAFRQDYSTNWSAYVAEAEEQLFQAIEASRRVRDVEPHPSRDREQSLIAVEAQTSSSCTRPTSATPSSTLSLALSLAPAPHYASSNSLAGLKALLAGSHLPDEGLEQFLSALKQAIADVGAAHPELLRLVWPYREYITANDGLATLKRNLDRIQAQCDDVTVHDTR